MKRYPEYKDSGVEWIGDIPFDWEIKKLKYLIEGKLMYGANEAAEDDIPENPRYIRITDFADDGKLKDDTFKSLPYDIARNYLLKDGDVLFARSGATVGKTFQYRNYIGLACFAGYLIKASPRTSELDSDFLYYYTKSGIYENWKNIIFIQATIQNIGADKYSCLSIPVPPITNQKGIAAFLSHKTRQIDDLIAKKKRLIELLQEERTALINQAVTKGLNPHVPMKDSGIEWLGEIPEKWSILPIKKILKEKKYSLKTGPFGSQLKSSDMLPEGVKVYNQRTVYDNDYTFGEFYVSEDKFQDLKEFQVFPEDILISSRGTIGKCSIVPSMIEKGILHPCLIRLQLNQSIMLNDYFLWYVNHSSLFLESVNYFSNATTIEVIYSDTLKNIKIPVPDLKHQQGIIDFLNVKVGEIEKIIHRWKIQLSLFLEYKTSLINEAVTGKIDVRDNSQ